MPTAVDPPSALAHTARELSDLQLRRDSQALKELRHRIGELDGTITANELASLRLSESLRALRSEREMLSRRLDMLSGDIQDLTRSACPASICTEDVLRLIFSHQSREDDPQWHTLGYGRFNKARALAPFTVSAVCRAWRVAALGCTEIWTYVGIPALEDFERAQHALHVDRVRLVLSRSGSMPLDVLIQDISDDGISAYKTILDCLYEHSHRWRRCEFYASIEYTYFHNYLRGSLPLLEELHVRSAASDDGPVPMSWAMASSRGYMGHCPKLREASLKFYMPFHIDSNRQALQNLQSLTCQLHHTLPSIPSPLFWRLFASLPALRTLDLNMLENIAIESPSETLELPALHKLVLRSFAVAVLARFPTSVRMASLEHLSLQFVSGATTRMDDLVEFFSACTRSLRTLSIYSLDLDTVDGLVLSHLTDVVELILTDCTIDLACLLGLQGGLSALLVLRILGTKKTFADEETVEELLQLIRNRVSLADDASQPRARLIEVEVGPSCGLSRRDQLEIRKLLAS